MTSKPLVKVCIVFCITAILWVAVCGCDDLGAYSDVTDYYSSFGEIVLIDDESEEGYLIEEKFYNEQSRENFLNEEDRVPSSEYVYMAIPFKRDIEMDSVALYLESKEDVTVYINVYVSDDIPDNWLSLKEFEENRGSTGSASDDKPKYDDPHPDQRIGEVTVNLKKESWGSFVLDTFRVGQQTQNSIQIKDGQYLLLQFRNNSGVRELKEGKVVDPQTGLEIPKAKITMTNLLIRALGDELGVEAKEAN